MVGSSQSPKGTLMALLAVFNLLPTAPLAARTVTDETGRQVNVPEHPHRLISLAPSITETLYALGAGGEIVGDTDYCDYPPEARSKPHVGAVLNPSLEKIVSLKPDLVLGITDANRRETADQLERLGIPLYGLSAHTLADTFHLIEDLGPVLDRGPEAQRLVEQLQRRIAAVEKRVAGEPRPTVLFVVWYRPLITAGPETFISDIIRLAGGKSVGDESKGEWPHLSLEEVLRRNPEVILFPRTQSLSPGPDELKHLPAWKELRAIKTGRVYLVSDAIVRPSPRLVDSLEEVAGLLHPLLRSAARTLAAPEGGE